MNYYFRTLEVYYFGFGYALFTVNSLSKQKHKMHHTIKNPRGLKVI